MEMGRYNANFLLNVKLNGFLNSLHFTVHSDSIWSLPICLLVAAQASSCQAEGEAQ